MINREGNKRGSVLLINVINEIDVMFISWMYTLSSEKYHLHGNGSCFVLMVANVKNETTSEKKKPIL